MNIKRKRILSICLVLVLISIPYVAFVRDWSKPTFIDEHWLECTVDKINSYNELSDIYDDLIKDGDFFNVGEQDDFSNGINAINGYFNFSIVSNKNSAKSFYNIGTVEDLNMWLDDEFGKFRPIFNLMSRKYIYENGSCWISPNLKSKNEFGFSESNDNIMVVIFCEQFTMIIEQSDWGGDKPFQRFFLMFYELLENNNE